MTKGKGKNGESRVIGPFRGRYRWLSNFFEAPTSYDGTVYPTTEHAYQASKTELPHQRKLILACNTPGQAKRSGRLVTTRSGWMKMRVDVMHEIVTDKFERNPELAVQLIRTGQRELVEYNRWHDNYWGHCTCNDCIEEMHFNHLGEVLMQVRGELWQRCADGSLMLAYLIKPGDILAHPEHGQVTLQGYSDNMIVDCRVEMSNGEVTYFKMADLIFVRGADNG